MKKINFKEILPHIVAVLVFIIASFIYFSPVLNNKQLSQSDMSQFEGMSKSLVDYHKQTGDYSEWTDSMFGGMPAYQLINSPNYNVTEFIAKPLTLGSYNLSAGVLFLLGFRFLCIYGNYESKSLDVYLCRFDLCLRLLQYYYNRSRTHN